MKYIIISLSIPIVIEKWVCILMGRRVTRVGVGVCFAGMFRGMFRGMSRGYVSGMFRGIRSYFTCNFGGMLRGMFRGYVSGYVTGYVSRVCNPCAILKPEPPKKTQTQMIVKSKTKFGISYEIESINYS